MKSISSTVKTKKTGIERAVAKSNAADFVHLGAGATKDLAPRPGLEGFTLSVFLTIFCL